MQLLGISANNPFSQKTFADSLKLPYPLLSDFPDLQVIRSYVSFSQTRWRQCGHSSWWISRGSCAGAGWVSHSMSSPPRRSWRQPRRWCRSAEARGRDHMRDARQRVHGHMLVRCVVLVVLLVSGAGLVGGTGPARRAQPFRIGALTSSWGPAPWIVGVRDGLLALGYHENEHFVIGVRFTQGIWPLCRPRRVNWCSTGWTSSSPRHLR